MLLHPSRWTWKQNAQFPFVFEKKRKKYPYFCYSGITLCRIRRKKRKKKKKNRLDNWTAGQSFGAGKPNQTRARNDF